MTPRKITVDKLSKTSLLLRMMFDNNLLATATGFIYKDNEQYYLITNWHNVAGKDPISGKCLHSNAGIPNKIETRFFKIIDGYQEAVTNYNNWCSINLYNDSEMDTPVWYEHPRHKNLVDVVAIPLSLEIISPNILFPINKINLDNNFEKMVADDVFVIGYPFAKNFNTNFPIWKKGSIATEPDIDIDNLPKFLIDTATRSGLSGSPVVMRRHGLHGLKNSKMHDDTLIGTIENFVGIYSGRIGESQLEAQLGIVWKANVIKEIVDGKCIGSRGDPRPDE